MEIKCALTRVVVILISLTFAVVSLPASAAIRTLNFTGVLTCVANCSSPNIELDFYLQNAGFSGSYTYDDSILPQSSSILETKYLGVISLTVTVKSATYVFTMQNGGLTFRRNVDQNGNQIAGYDRVTIGPTWTVSGPGKYAIDRSQTLPIHYFDTASGNILPSTLITDWPQTTAAWAAPAFAGVTIALVDDAPFPPNTVIFRGAFITLKHAGEGMDVDGNGTYDALTDGILMMRYLFGLRGASLIANAVGANATRTTAEAIEAYLQAISP